MSEEKIAKYEKLVKLITGEFEIDGKNYKLEQEFDKFYVQGNKSCAPRIRKFMQEIKNICKEVRDDVQEYKKTLGRNDSDTDNSTDASAS